MNKKLDIIKILQKIETIIQMQYDSKEYLESKFSIFPYFGNSKDTKTFIINLNSDFDIIDNFVIDMEGLDLCDVTLTLHSLGFLNKKEVIVLCGESQSPLNKFRGLSCET
ncbi:MAG: hypothetical protein M0Q13_15415 [Methanothrix sp.]|nr:hypothetical protein [Methanothrix sp.]